MLPMQAKTFPALSWVTLMATVVTGLSSVVSAQGPLFTSRVDLVQVGVSVVDGDGVPVAGLTRDDFELYEDGERQQIEYFARGLATDVEAMPLHVGVLLDASGSMERESHFAQTAAIKFLNTLTYAADMTVVDFDTEVRVGRYAPADFPRLVERIRNSRTTGDTALYDALGVYLDGAFAQDGRKVLLLYTDGADTRSRTSLSAALDLVKASDVTIYAIAFQKHLPNSLRPIERMRLQQLTDVTGGRCFFPDDVDELDAIYDQIVDELNTRYSVGYVSDNDRSDGTWRKVEVKIRASGTERGRTEVRNREGYYATYRDDQP